MNRKLTLIILLLYFFIMSAALVWLKEEKPSKPAVAKLAFVPHSFKDLKNWKKDHLAEAFHAYQLSCQKTKSCQINNAKDFRKFLEQNFVPHLVVYNGSSEGKFTSYYESALSASYHRSEKYQYPVYGKPKDLVEFNLKDFDKNADSKRFVGRVKDGRLIPYYTRAEIDNAPLDAPVILWADDAIDIYVMQIQGSAVAELDNGSKVRIGYADNNGHPFRGIGSILLEQGLIGKGQVSMGKIKIWLKENGELASQNMLKNDRFVFHRLIDAEGPIGAQGVPLTPGRSLAVDKKYIPLGSLLWLETTGPDNEKIEKLVVAQDIGSAIEGPIRGDYFWGSGGDDILELAGRMNSKGRYFILLPKKEKP